MARGFPARCSAARASSRSRCRRRVTRSPASWQSVKGCSTAAQLLDRMGVGAYAPSQIDNARTPHRLDMHGSRRSWMPIVADETVRRDVLRRRLRHAYRPHGRGRHGAVRVAKVPKDLPVLFIAGAEDPVGACGKGVASRCRAHAARGRARCRAASVRWHAPRNPQRTGPHPGLY